MKMFILFFLSLPFFCMANIKTLDVDIIDYDAFAAKTPEAIEQLQTALLKRGLVGIRGVPGYKEKAANYINALRSFSSLPMETKKKYSPDGMTEKAKHFLGFNDGGEKFRLPNGQWVVDDQKYSIYSIYPDMCENRWPEELDLKTPFEEICAIVTDVGKTILEDIELISPKTGMTRDSLAPHVCRQLHYSKSGNTETNNPYWCGAHFDHGLFTGLL
ncbi:MAG: 2-oxoglutarate and iron-dependent oxygenase domain-containing protein, partial [Simkaniaceae bacterium]|nr:2-oxoglutarate and iron-dependent oxygenase domain-containing protein [Simkaniaceae bacterium]